MKTRKGMLTRSFWYSVGVYIVFNSLFLAFVIIKPGPTRQFVIMDDIGQALGWLLGTIFCLVGLQLPIKRWFSRSETTETVEKSAQKWVPLFFAAGIFCQFIGQVIYTYYDIKHMKDFPSLADFAYLSTFPFFFLAFYLLPTRPLFKTTRERVILDGFIIMVAAITFSWFFVLGPTMLQGQETILAKIVGSAYPFFDLVLIFCVLRLMIRSNEPALWPAVQLLVPGFLIIVITDSIYDYMNLGTYTNGWQDAGWPLGYMLIGLAAQALIIARRRKTLISFADSGTSAAIDVPVRFEWFSILPYVLIPAVFGLMVYVWQSGKSSTLEEGVYFGGAVLIGLVVLRQYFVIRQTHFFNRQLQSIQQELSLKNQALSDANKQLEDQAQQLEAAYEQQVHLNEIKDQFLLNVNHELRTPLTEIHGYLDLLSEYRGQLDESLRDTFIEHAMHGSEELLHLVSNVLDTIRGDVYRKAPQFEELSMAHTVNEVIALFEPNKQQDYELKVHIAESLMVRADRQYLHQVLVNLLSNAFKYSPPGTAIEVRVELRVKAADSEIQEPSSEALVSVQDAGPGIPSADIALLFGKFVRLKRDMVGTVRGTGLGLYISKQLVESMGGRIWVESTGVPGEGSRFCFTLASVSAVGVIEQATPLPLIMESDATIQSSNVESR
ncbi:MAG TPA: HAMP domain-containing sensor histidine kinase [Ktedonobacteraceae bacterium]|nr:HAMP domain-containing sensor histidine kinase [Ktedonobacteraceae bacterium]